jgi:hypothetical protein
MWSYSRNEKRTGAAALAVVSTALLLGQPQQATADPNGEPEVTGVRIQIDNDLFAAHNTDRDYTGGFGVTVSGTAARNNVLSLDALLGRINDLLGVQTADNQMRHAQQLGLLAFTPVDIETSRVQRNDRPYASLAFVANGRVQVEPSNRVAWGSTVTVGMLGLSASRDIQNAIHEVVGSPQANGYDHQISAGGEPTARYTLARQQLLIANASSTIDIKSTVQGSVGYLTEASVGLSARIGRFSSPWWSAAPEQTDYLGAPLPVELSRSAPEVYVLTGVRLKARAYNAFLQGQFRHSDVTYSAAEVEPVIGEAWIGVVTQIGGQTQASYLLNYQTQEIKDGPAARSALWGAVQLTHSF